MRGMGLIWEGVLIDDLQYVPYLLTWMTILNRSCYYRASKNQRYPLVFDLWHFLRTITCKYELCSTKMQLSFQLEYCLYFCLPSFLSQAVLVSTWLTDCQLWSRYLTENLFLGQFHFCGISSNIQMPMLSLKVNKSKRIWGLKRRCAQIILVPTACVFNCLQPEDVSEGRCSRNPQHARYTSSYQPDTQGLITSSA